MFRLENSYSDRKDEIDGIYLNLKVIPANWHRVLRSCCVDLEFIAPWGLGF